jgi:hypothetical protein
MNTLAPISQFDRLEAAIAQLPEVEPEITHHFAPGVYAREMRLVAGTMLTGKVHKTKHLNIVQGDITVFNEVSGEGRRITGYDCFVSEPGTRRAGFAHAPTSWITVHPTQETDLAKIEDEVIEEYDNPLLENGRALP